MNEASFYEKFNGLFGNVQSVFHGKPEVVRLALVAMASGGHVLFEDAPGTGKTVLARAIAQSVKLNAARVQCTPDLLPGDVTGSSIFDQKKQDFVFRPGPVFTNVLLVDEINRATPKTQSALLEAMSEGKVTVDGHTMPIPPPFFVLATQNPIELAGTFPLPEAQLDRFLFKLSIGYPSEEAETQVIRSNSVRPAIDDLGPVLSKKELLQMIEAASAVEIPPAVETFIVRLVQSTRAEPAFMLGASPRACIALAKAGRALAASDGRASVYPEDVKMLFGPVMRHRVLLTAEASLNGESVDAVLNRLVERTKPPLGLRVPA